MLTESCVMFFSPSRAVLSAILRDEYLTSAVRTKEGDKAGSNQPSARDPVQFKLELAPNYLITPDPLDMYPCPIQMRAHSFQNFVRKAILKLQDQLSQHDWCKNLNQRHLRYARRFKSTNQRIMTIGRSKPQPFPAQGCLFGCGTLIGGLNSLYKIVIFQFNKLEKVFSFPRTLSKVCIFCGLIPSLV